MTNRFDAVNYPEGVPDELVKGDRWVWRRTDLGVDYPSASYSVHWVFRRHGADDEQTITATASGTDYLAEVASTATDLWGAGTYEVQTFVTRTADSERFSLTVGRLEVAGNVDDGLSGDPRSDVKRILDALQAMMLDKADVDQSSYSISTPGGSRTLSRLSPAEVVAWEGVYRHRYALEVDRERVARGLPSRRKLKMRLG